MAKLINFAAAVSGRKQDVIPTTKLTPLRLTNNGAETATVSFDNRFNNYVTRLQYRRDDTAAFADWDLSEVPLEPNGYMEIAGDNSETQGFLGQFSMSGNNIAASGNIMSLIYGVETTKDVLVIPTGISFGLNNGRDIKAGMFYNCEGLTTAPELPATTLSDLCYLGMFANTGITSPPDLPAVKLTEKCYAGMFYNCMSLTTAPELPATTLSVGCYYYMFAGTSIQDPPVLPAMELADGCYMGMFQNTDLFSCPNLPATELKPYCYCRMFEGCLRVGQSNLLPARYLEEYCYAAMFAGCTSLYEVQVLFEQWKGEATEQWLEGVNADGTFTCPPNLDTTSEGDSFIPVGWEVEYFD